MGTMQDALTVACNYCRAPVGSRCVALNRHMGGPARAPHLVRAQDARRLAERGEVRTGNGWQRVRAEKVAEEAD